jgi:hypothetical protein
LLNSLNWCYCRSIKYDVQLNSGENMTKVMISLMGKLLKKKENPTLKLNLLDITIILLYSLCCRHIIKQHKALRLNWQVCIVRILREGNNCTDFLAKIEVSSDLNRLVQHTPPHGLRELLFADSSETWFQRV